MEEERAEDSVFEEKQVEKEWELLQQQSNMGRIEISKNERAKKICKGLKMYAETKLDA